METLRTRVWSAPGGGPEKRELVIGVTPLVDAAPIVLAHDKALFRRHGLEVTLSVEPSWANIRDKLATGALDAAHMLAPMPIAATLGVGPLQQPVVTALSLNLGGNTIALSNALHARLAAREPEALARPLTRPRALREVIDEDARRGAPPLRFGVVFPVSMHAYELRDWLASAGIDPDRDVALRVVPPPRMVAALRAGEIDGFCVGEPWGGLAVELGLARIVAAKRDLWGAGPEKVLGVDLVWAERHPGTHRALLRALIEAARLAESPVRRDEVVCALARGPLHGVTPRVVERALAQHVVFHRHAATFPWRSHAAWIVAQMLRWGQLEKALDVRRTAASVFRTDLYREAAAELGEPLPRDDEKLEGAHDAPWRLVSTCAGAPIAMPRDRFANGEPFDPRRVVDHLAACAIHARSVSLDELEAAQS